MPLMLTLFQCFSIIAVLLVPLGGGYAPLFSIKSTSGDGEFPLGEAFAAGVFPALSLTIMLPAGFNLFQAMLNVRARRSHNIAPISLEAKLGEVNPARGTELETATKRTLARSSTEFAGHAEIV